MVEVLTHKHKMQGTVGIKEQEIQRLLLSNNLEHKLDKSLKA